MLWNELNYTQQVKIMNLVEDLLLKQTDIEIQDGMVAALTELEMWSHRPCQTYEEPDPFIAFAVDQEIKQ